MLKNLTLLLLNAVRAIGLRPIAAVSANAMNAPPKMLDQVAAALTPKIADELRHRPGGNFQTLKAAP
jgi:hypothetical protein